MNNLLQSLKNSSQQIIVLTLIFIAGVLVSAYKIFMLPHDLMFYGNVSNVALATGVFVQLSIAVIITFVLGIITIAVTIQSKKETIVFVEKKRVEENGQTTETQTEGSSILDIESIKTQLDKCSEENLLQEALNTLCELTQAGQGAIYLITDTDGKQELELKFGFALAVAETASPRFELGEGLIGQVAISARPVYLDEVPEGYITIVSGLGNSFPRYLLILPLKTGNLTRGVMELATFNPIPEGMRAQLEEMVIFIASKLK